MLCKVMIAFVEVCGRSKLGVNAAKSKVMVVETEGEYDCNVRRDEGNPEGINKFIYLGDR